MPTGLACGRLSRAGPSQQPGGGPHLRSSAWQLPRSLLSSLLPTGPANACGFHLAGVSRVDSAHGATGYPSRKGPAHDPNGLTSVLGSFIKTRDFAFTTGRASRGQESSMLIEPSVSPPQPPAPPHGPFFKSRVPESYCKFRDQDSNSIPTCRLPAV